MQPAKPGSQKTYQIREFAGPRGRDGGHGRSAAGREAIQDTLLQAFAASSFARASPRMRVLRR
jgi:hypothetical protein